MSLAQQLGAGLATMGMDLPAASQARLLAYVALLKKWVPNIDPEQFGFSSDNLVGLESTGLPTTRSIGFNLNVRF